MADHSVVFNVRIQMPGTKPGTGQISYEQMMNTFDRTRREGMSEGWNKAMRELRKAAEGASNETEAHAVLDVLIAQAVKFKP